MTQTSKQKIIKSLKVIAIVAFSLFALWSCGEADQEEFLEVNNTSNYNYLLRNR